MARRLGGGDRPWYGLRAAGLQQGVPRRAATAGHGMVGAREGRSQRATSAWAGFNPLVQRRPATAGHGMVCARGRAPTATAGGTFAPKVTCPRGPASGGGTFAPKVTCPRGPASGGGTFAPKVQQIVDRLVKNLGRPQPAAAGGTVTPAVTARWVTLTGHSMVGAQGPGRHRRPRPVTAGHGRHSRPRRPSA